MDRGIQVIRAFIAIELPPAVRALLDTVQKELRESMGEGAGSVKWVRPEGTHLTLQFLGDVRTDQLAAIEQGIERACAGVGPFELNVEKLGVFPNLRRPRVIWIGLEGSEQDKATLNRLHAGIAAQLSALGFKPDHSFKPHLTLGRVRDAVTRDELAAIVETFTYPEEQPVFETTFEVKSVSF